MKRVPQLVYTIAIFGGAAGLYPVPAFSQNTAILNDGSGTRVVLRFDKSAGTGPRQKAGSGGGVTGGINSNPFGGMQYYTADYTSFGKSYPFNIIGTDPSLGAATTTIPTVIVPIHITFATTGATLDGTNVVPAVQNSPLFLTADYTTGGTDLGVTQYGDAIQRAEFWNLPGFSPNYHVLLGAPTVQPTVFVTVPATGCPADSHNPNGFCGTTYAAGHLGVVNGSWFDNNVINTLFSAYAPNVLPVFVTDNVFEAGDGTVSTCCTLGYHNSEGPPATTAHTWIYAAYTEPGTFGGNVILDVQPLSHEVAEWMNDPFVGAFALGFINLIPPAVLPGQGGACIPNFETGDPLEAPPVVFTQVTNSTTYHLQDEAFLSWYMHSNFGVNGKYSYLGAFTTPSSLCGPG
jgi:hypothetical protein